MKTSSPLLFDTNILVYNQDQDSKFYKIASDYHQKAITGEIRAAISQQNLLEFSSVMINPKKIKKPLSQKEVALEIAKYLDSSVFEVISPNIKTLPSYLNLFNRYKLKSPRDAFDFFLVATMLSNSIKHILTLNKKDFTFKEIEVIAA